MPSSASSGNRQLSNLIRRWQAGMPVRDIISVSRGNGIKERRNLCSPQASRSFTQSAASRTSPSAARLAAMRARTRPAARVNISPLPVLRAAARLAFRLSPSPTVRYIAASASPRCASRAEFSVMIGARQFPAGRFSCMLEGRCAETGGSFRRFSLNTGYSCESGLKSSAKFQISD